MTKSDLISTIADAAGCSKGAAGTAYDRLIDKIASTITASTPSSPTHIGVVSFGNVRET